VVHLDLQISPQIVEKIRNGRKVILWGWGETDSWKNQKQKISCHCPFKDTGELYCLYLLVDPVHTAGHLGVGGGGAVLRPVSAPELRIAEVAGPDTVLPVRVTPANNIKVCNFALFSVIMFLEKSKIFFALNS
jgi:hypothetical protein